MVLPLNQIEESLRKQFKNHAKQKRILDVDNFIKGKMESNAVIIPSPLVSPDFSPKIQKMLSKPKLPKNLQVIRIKGEKLVKEICSSLQINMIRSGSPPKHKWELFDG